MAGSTEGRPPSSETAISEGDVDRSGEGYLELLVVLIGSVRPCRQMKNSSDTLRFSCNIWAGFDSRVHEWRRRGHPPRRLC